MLNALFIQAFIHGRTFNLFELQRKKNRQGNLCKDEQISGLTMNIYDPHQAREEISKIFDKFQNVAGKFAALEG